MNDQQSFAKYEHEFMPMFRDRVNTAESVGDVRKAFSEAMEKLLLQVLGGNPRVTREDVIFDPLVEPWYSISEDLADSGNFREIMNRSDLPRILARYAEKARGRYLRLKKNPARTEQKIRM
jgi:hypothetical protein